MLRQLTITDSHQCAAIHLKNSLAWSHNAKLGIDHLKNIYRTVLESKEGFGWGYFQDEELVSFITATSDIHLTNKKLYGLLTFRQYLRILSQIIRHPGEFLDMIEAKIVMPRVIDRLAVKAFLLTWHNNFELKYNPYAPIMVMNQVLKDLKEQGFQSAMTQVDAKNERPNEYYHKVNARLCYSSRWNNIYEVRTTKQRPQRAANLKSVFDIMDAKRINEDDLFSVPDMPVREKFLRQYIAPLAAKLPQPLYYRLTTLAKKLRNPKGTLALRYPLDFAECRSIAEGLKGLKLKPWWAKRAVVCLTHDVDNQKGMRFIGTMVSINKRFGLPATVNFLTDADYALDKNLLGQLFNDGFEVGLHGTTHDQGFAFRYPALMKSELARGLNKLADYHVAGYRSPALSVSRKLFWALNQTNFRYDSTLQVASPFYHSVRLPYPVYLKEYDLWEIPLMVQDDNYLRDTQTPQSEIFRSLDRFIDEVKQLNGVCVINMHPHLMADRQAFYEEFARWLAQKDDVTVKTIKDVVDYISAVPPDGTDLTAKAQKVKAAV